MIEQIVDKVTIGIPSDELEIYADCERFANESATNATRAESAKDLSEQKALEAYRSAAEAKAWVLANGGYWVAPTEPPADKILDGVMWWQTNTDKTVIEHIWRWDAENGGLYPKDDLYPSNDLYPRERGSWVEMKLAATTLVDGS